MRVLVTGSSGFIGPHLLHRLTMEGHTVVGVDINDPTKPLGQARFRKCDILDAAAVRAVFNEFQPEGVIHLAARTDLDETRDLAGYAVNIDGVRNVIAAVRATGAVKRALYTSTQLVCKLGYKPAHVRDYCPSTKYGESKVAGERIVIEEDGGGVTWCIVRPTTIWGAGMRQHYVRFFRMIENGRFFFVGRGDPKKSYGYVGNTAFQYARLLEAPPEVIHGKTFYVTDYEPITLREWIGAFRDQLNGPPIPTYPIFAARAAARVGDVLNTIGFRKFPFNSFRLNNVLTEFRFDVGELAEICGPLPFTMDDGVREMVSWLRSLER